MKLTINSRVLKSALESANKAINPKPTIPALANFLLEGNGVYLTITGSDGNTTIKETIPCETEGKVLLPTNLLELVRTLPEGDITIETEDNTAKVSWKNGQSTLPTFPVNEYPEIPQYAGTYFTIKGNVLANALAYTLPHTANDDLRPVMNGVFFNSKDGVIDFVASDAHTLALYKVATDHKEPFDFIVDKTAVKVMADKVNNEDAEFAADERNIYFRTDTTEIVARRIEGKFPNYASIIPTTFTSTLTADKAALIGSIRRVMVCSSKASGHIKLNLGMLESTIEAQDLSMQSSAREVLEGVTFDGTDLSIGFKGELLLKSIAVIEGGDVKINLNGPQKAAIVTGDNDMGLSLVMPVNIQ